MSTQEFLFLLVGMLDVTAPNLTEPFEDKVSRAMRETRERNSRRGKGR